MLIKNGQLFMLKPFWSLKRGPGFTQADIEKSEKNLNGNSFLRLTHDKLSQLFSMQRILLWNLSSNFVIRIAVMWREKWTY